MHELVSDRERYAVLHYPLKFSITVQHDICAFCKACPPGEEARGRAKSAGRRGHTGPRGAARPPWTSEDVVHSLSVGGVTVRLYAEGTSECD